VGTALAIRGGRHGHRHRAVETARDRPPPWIWYVAGLTVLVRLAAVWPPLRPDEAGFLLVARAWDPASDSMFGHYWVDRPPLMIAVVAAADLLGGPHFLRVVGAVGCGLLVVLAARLGWLIGGAPAAGWTAVTVGLLAAQPMIDVVSVKAEHLGMPIVVASFLATLSALRRRSWPLILLAGLLAGLAPGLKQNLVSGLVFGVVVLIGMRASRRIEAGTTVRLAAAWIAGAVLPALAQVVWAVIARVDLSSAWYAVYGFRFDAAEVLASPGGGGPSLERAGRLLDASVVTGIAIVLLLFVAAIRAAWSADAVLAAATVAVVVTEVAMVALGGSYWTVYLFTLVPGVALCVAQLARLPGAWGASIRGIAIAVAFSFVWHLSIWSTGALAGEHEFTEYRTGEAVGEAAAPDDTLVVFGGRADLQFASGLPSPYPHLWSLPMRTLDPEYADLVALLESPRAPTWLVTWVPVTSWDAPGANDLRAAIDADYERHGTGCDDRPVYLLKGVDRPAIEPDC
jgi:hypothetical protein